MALGISKTTLYRRMKEKDSFPSGVTRAYSRRSGRSCPKGDFRNVYPFTSSPVSDSLDSDWSRKASPICSRAPG